MSFKEWFELNEEKDACYYKVKATASVWPSAYASGRLVQCREKGAKNYGKSGKKKKKKHMQQESVQIDEGDGLKQRSDAMNAAMALNYNGLDATSMSSQEIIKALNSMGKPPPEGVSPVLFAVRVKMVAREAANKNEFKEGTFDLEKERGLKGWFDRNNGKGWIDIMI